MVDLWHHYRYRRVQLIFLAVSILVASIAFLIAVSIQIGYEFSLTQSVLDFLWIVALASFAVVMSSYYLVPKMKSKEKIESMRKELEGYKMEVEILEESLKESEDDVYADFRLKEESMNFDLISKTGFEEYQRWVQEEAVSPKKVQNYAELKAQQAKNTIEKGEVLLADKDITVKEATVYQERVKKSVEEADEAVNYYQFVTSLMQSFDE